MTLNAKGILAALVSNILFSMLFFYGVWMAPMVGSDIFAWRVVGMYLVLLSVITAFGMWEKTLLFMRNIGKNARRWLLIALPTPIAAGQLWLFMWAPLNGKGVDVAMGYFLFPLAMMLGGVVVFREPLAKKQRLAVALAAIGVMLEIWRTGSFSWATVAVFATYPVYYLLRRWQRVPAMTGLLIDFSLMFPFALMYILFFSPSLALMGENPWLWAWVPVLGLHSVIAMQCNLAANAWLPVVLFGMLSYLEPALLFVVSVVFLGEPLHLGTLLSYSFIWAGIAVMIWHSRQTLPSRAPHKAENA